MFFQPQDPCFLCKPVTGMAVVAITPATRWGMEPQSLPTEAAWSSQEVGPHSPPPGSTQPPPTPIMETWGSGRLGWVSQPRTLFPISYYYLMEESFSNILIDLMGGNVDKKSSQANWWLDFWERAKRKEEALQMGRDRTK